MRESVGRTVTVAAVLCIVCSIIVAASASLLRSRQRLNAELDFKKNILTSAGLLGAEETSVDDKRVQELFKNIEPVVVDLETGKEVSGVEPASFDQEKADKAPENLDDLRGEDVAGIRQRSRMQTVYFVKKDGKLDQVVLRIYGRGLWSTIYGFLALDKDLVTVRGLNFYSHGETPGLGGEIDNPRWKAQWKGKKVFEDGFKPVISIVKNLQPNDPRIDHKVDALSGATITSNGVQNALRFWLSPRGYGKFLADLRQGGMP